MGFMKKLAVVSLIVAICVGVIMVKFPVPNDMEEKWIARAVGVVESSADVTSSILAKLKIGNKLEMFKSLAEYCLRALSLSAQPGIKEHWETIADTPVMFFDPDGREKNGPVIIYLHGGGWTFFSPKSYRYVTQSLAKETKYLVLSVDYPLAPKHVHPAQKNACLNVVRHVLKHAEKWGVDKNKVIIAGDSAGGQLTAAVSLELKDNNPESAIPKIAAQIAIYPALQFADFTLPSYQNDTGVVLSTEFTVWFSQLHAFGTVDPKRIHSAMQGKHISAKYNNVLKTKIDHRKLPKANFHKDYKKHDFTAAVSEYPELEKVTMDTSFSPLLNDDFKNTPPTLIFTMQYDVLRDDGYLYANKLREDGVHVEHINYNGWHGAMAFRTKFPFFKDMATFLKKVFEGKK